VQITRNRGTFCTPLLNQAKFKPETDFIDPVVVVAQILQLAAAFPHLTLHCGREMSLEPIRWLTRRSCPQAVTFWDWEVANRR
jgi:hypothetical protein